LATGSALTWDGSLLSTTVADNTVGVKFKAATSNIRFLPQDGGAAKIAALNAAESAFYPLITQGSSLQYVIDTTEVGRFTSAGLGISTSSPAAPFQAGQVTVIQQDANSGYVGANFGGGTSGTYIKSQFAVRTIYDSGTGAIGFDTAPSGTAGGAVTFTRTATVTSTGLGIGTSSPSTKLQVVATTATTNLTSSTGTNQAYHQVSNSAGNMYFGINNSSNSFFSASAYAGVVWHDGAYPLVFGTSNAERARIDASGNLGLGAAPSAWGAGSKALQINSNLSLWSLSSTNNYVYANAYFDGTNDKYVSTAEAARIRFAGATTIFNYAASGSANANITWQESFRTDTSGRLLVGCTATDSGAQFRFQYDTGQNGLQLFDNSGASGSTFAIFGINSGGNANIGSIARVAATSAVVYNTTSDYRLKTVTGVVTGHGSRIDALKPIDYVWTEGGQQARGFLAHEFQTVYPNSVSGDKDAVDANGNPKYQAMQAATSEVIADLVAEIQSLRQRLSAANL
jgi:hypothetical protein